MRSLLVSRCLVLALLVGCTIEVEPGLYPAGSSVQPDVGPAMRQADTGLAPDALSISPVRDSGILDVGTLDGGELDLSFSDGSLQMDTGTTDALTADGSVSVLDGGPDGAALQDAVVDMAGAQPDAEGEDALVVDLQLLADRLAADIWMDEKRFSENDCAVVEGCIQQPGLRRLLRFSVATANVGDGDLVLGIAEERPDDFVFSACHGHYHYEGYASYELSAGDDVVASGHKQAFCLMDVGRYIEDDDTVRGAARYTCRFQGISRGWQDTYGSHLDCQWIDITDVEPGNYDLTVRINRERNLQELSYENNDGTIPVRVPEFNLAQDCGPEEMSGLKRSCGWVMREVGACEQGDVVEVSCGGCNGQGEPCIGNPMLRVCDGELTQCLRSLSLAESDNSCDTLCPEARFLCPESGRFTIWTSSHDARAESTCNFSVHSAPPDLVEPCAGDEPNGLERTCGWVAALVAEPCLPGFEYRVGCARDDVGACQNEGPCEGDPMLRVCGGKTTCLSQSSLAQNDDSCGARCSEATFECPLQGKITAFTASYQTGANFACELQMDRIGQ